MLELIALNWFVVSGEVCDKQGLRSALESSSNDLDDDGKDDTTNNVSHFIGMHQLFLIMKSVRSI